MTIVCWTVIKQAVAPVAHAVGSAKHIDGVVRHVARPRLYRAVLRPRAWITTVCKVSVIGGSLLIPQATAPPLADLPQAFVDPATTLWMPLEPLQVDVDDATRVLFVPPAGPDVPAGIRDGPSAGVVSEPASLFVLLVGAVCVAVLRWRHARSRPGAPR